MKLKAVPETPLEWLALRLNLVPLPLLHGQIFPVISKALLTAADKGIFKAVEPDPLTAEEIAVRCGLHPNATRQLLRVLTSSGYLNLSGSRYRLTSLMRKWVLDGSAADLTDLLIYNNRVVWKWMEQMDVYLETGIGVDYHRSFGDEEWNLYQKAMRAVARSEVKEFARNCPMPRNAGLMLDIGGAHGLHVQALKARYPGLSAHILDLPGAWEVQEEQENKEWSVIRASILDTELMADSYDFVLMSSLAHHFGEDDNRLIAKKVAAALRPGGIYVINEFVRPDQGFDRSGIVGASSDLFFGLTSTSGTWTVSETQGWQRDAGLRPLKPVGYIAIPGRFQLAARKEG